jgi:Transketolase, C-terminal domain
MGASAAQQLVASATPQVRKPHHDAIHLHPGVHVAVTQVINLRTLKPIDRDAIVKSVTKTHRVVVVEEGWPQSGVASGTAAPLLFPGCFRHRSRCSGSRMDLSLVSHMYSCDNVLHIPALQRSSQS